MSKKLLTTQEAADVIGVSAAVFRRIAADLEAKPDGYYIAHKKRCPKWSLETIEHISSSDQIQAALKRKAEKRSNMPPEEREIEEQAEKILRNRSLKKLANGP